MSDRRMVTIKDISQRLKLSVSTVSRALRGGSEIKKETRELVQELAAQLNYTPNPIALSLREKKSRIIGVIVPEIANSFCSSSIAGIEDIAYKKGYHVVIFQSHEKYDREVINTKLLASRRIDGLIISVSNETNNFDHLKELIDNDIPVVMFDRVSDEIDTHKVIVNDYQGAFEATEHLIEQGHRDIAHFAISGFLSITQNRVRGYKDALKKHGIPFKNEWIVHLDFCHAEIEQAIKELFSAEQPPTAIMASVERLAIGCLRALKNMNIAVPEEVALIGFSDNPLNKLLSPSLSSVCQPTFDMGQKSAELLIELIENPPVSDKYRTIQLETSLEIMNSSKSPVIV